MTPAGYWKQTKSNGKYLFLGKIMREVYKGKFMEKLKKFLAENKIAMDVELRKKIYNLNWVVYAKQPFGGPKDVIEYLGRYSHKIAISNHRIKEIIDGKVTFTYKDYAAGGNQKLMTLTAEEFLRRFCLHILPPGFTKMRHYGFLSSRTKQKLRMEQMKLGVIPPKKEKYGWKTITKTKLGFDVEACPCCKSGRMICILNFAANAPPLALIDPLKSNHL